LERASRFTNRQPSQPNEDEFQLSATASTGGWLLAVALKKRTTVPWAKTAGRHAAKQGRGPLANLKGNWREQLLLFVADEERALRVGLGAVVRVNDFMDEHVEDRGGMTMELVLFLLSFLSTINNNSREHLRHAVSITSHSASHHNHTSG
jgi:hypothetical protein